MFSTHQNLFNYFSPLSQEAPLPSNRRGVMGNGAEQQNPKPPRSLFDLPSDFFDSSHVLLYPLVAPAAPPPPSDPVPAADVDGDRPSTPPSDHRKAKRAPPRWTCHTCGAEFESLLDQRSHFKTDLHRLNVKLHMKGKNIIKEEDFDGTGDDHLFEDCDVSSLSGSEDELETDANRAMLAKESKHKLFINLKSGETIFLWSCLLLDESEIFSFDKSPSSKEDEMHLRYVTEEELINRVKRLLVEPQDKSHLRSVLLVHGGHFAGCVFDGNNIVAHKTFHRYVVRAKAGKKQSAKDAIGRAASSAGSSLRRYNEAALKKEIQELLVSWKAYFAISKCILVHAPSKNSQLLFDGENPVLNHQKYPIRHVPVTVHRPTLKEAKRVYSQLTQVTFVLNEDRSQPQLEEPPLSAGDEENFSEVQKIESKVQLAEMKEESPAVCSDSQENVSSSPKIGETMSPNCTFKGTPLHDAAKSGDAQQVLELLEQGLDPTVKDSRGKTAYLLAKDKEIRNTFRRFMASNRDKWDWHAASVPSALTKEMEESQALRQAEKDAKRKARAKELKKLRKAKEKAQAVATQAATMLEKSATSNKPLGIVAATTFEGQSGLNAGLALSKEEERKRALDIEREKRAAAAERRIAALHAFTISQAAEPSNQGNPVPKIHVSNCGKDAECSCCNASLAGKVPFHRYNYKYCSTTCMHVHKEMLEDG